MTFSIADYPPYERTLIRIVDQGEVKTLDFDGAVTVHQGTLWWGAAIGYRAMQMAAVALSPETLWQRGNLYVVSGHPGPGVLDSLNFITGCRDNGMLNVIDNPKCVGMCNREMRFEWWVSNGEKTAHVLLRDDFLPDSFWELVGRMIEKETEEDQRKFDLFKVILSAKIWSAPLEENLSATIEEAVPVGEIPKTSNIRFDDPASIAGVA